MLNSHWPIGICVRSEITRENMTCKFNGFNILQGMGHLFLVGHGSAELRIVEKRKAFIGVVILGS